MAVVWGGDNTKRVESIINDFNPIQFHQEWEFFSRGREIFLPTFQRATFEISQGSWDLQSLLLGLQAVIIFKLFISIFLLDAVFIFPMYSSSLFLPLTSISLHNLLFPPSPLFSFHFPLLPQTSPWPFPSPFLIFSSSLLRFIFDLQAPCCCQSLGFPHPGDYFVGPSRGSSKSEGRIFFSYLQITSVSQHGLSTR